MTDSVDSQVEYQSDRRSSWAGTFRIANLFGVVAIAGTLLGSLARCHWIADALIQFRVQYLLALLPAVATWIIARRPRRVFLGLLTMSVNLYWLIPYFIPLDKEVNPSFGDSLRLAVFNVLRTNDRIDATF